MQKQHIQASEAGFKPERTPFLMFYTSDYLAAIAGLSLEEQGFYTNILFRMWDMKGGLPDDARWIANHMGQDPRVVRRIRGQLVKLGKLQSRDGFLTNPRMMRVIADHIRRTDKRAGREPQSIPTEMAPNLDQQQFDFAARANADAEASCIGLPADLREKSGNIFPESPIKSTDAPPIFHIPDLQQQDGERARAHDLVIAEPTEDDPARLISPEQHRLFRDLCDTFGQPGVMVIKPTPPQYAADQFSSTVRIALKNHAPDVHESAIAAALQDAQNAGLNPGGRGIGALNRYLHKALRSKATDIAIADAAAIAAARAEKITQEALLRKRLDGIEKGGGGNGAQRRRGAPMSWDDAWVEAEAQMRAQA